MGSEKLSGWTLEIHHPKGLSYIITGRVDDGDSWAHRRMLGAMKDGLTRAGFQSEVSLSYERVEVETEKPRRWWER